MRGLHGLVGFPLGLTAKRWGLGVVRVSSLDSLNSLTPLVDNVDIPNVVSNPGLSSW